MDTDEDLAARNATLVDMLNDPDIPLARDVEVIMPDSTLKEVDVVPEVDVASQTNEQLIVPDFLHSEPIFPNQGIPLQEPDKPVIHPYTGLELFPVVYEDIFGKRKRGSEVWKEFKFYKCSIGNLYAVCSHCRKAVYRAESSNGTSNPKRHIISCMSKQNKSSSSDGTRKDFDQNVYVELMAEAILMHGYPFSIIEHEGLRKVHKYLNEKVQTVSRNTIKKVCILKHVEFKEKIKKLLRALPGRVSLTSDLWTACTSRAYLTLTVHYVDDGWTLRSKVLNFVHFPPPHTGFQICTLLDRLIKEWGIEEKIFTMTLDNATNNDNMVTSLKSLLLEHMPCNGKFFHVRCCAHILNLVVKEGLKNIEIAVKKVRETVKYIDSSEARIIKFYICVEKCSLPSNTKLWMDVSTRWNSTYLMLKKAIFFRKAVDMFGLEECGFEHRLSPTEWLKVEKICNLLEPFYEITNIFSGSDYPTANLYFYNIWKIQRLLISARDGGDSDISIMASKMYKKFDKYWRDYSPVLSFAIILDPRYKYDFVLFALKKLHGDVSGARLAHEVNLQFVELFKDYEKKLPLRPCAATVRREENRHDLDEFDASYGSSNRDGGTEYERYFADDKEPRSVEIDVLKFWSKKVHKYPILSSMARDILAIPITTVASESTFSMGGRILNKWRSSLLCKNVEALVTTRNWLFGYEELDRLGVEVSTSKGDDDDDDF